MTTIPFYLYLKRETLKGRLLTYFFTHPQQSHHLRELASILHVDASNLSRDLKLLLEEGIFRSEVRGNLKIFSLNPNYSLYQELKSATQKSVLPAMGKGTEKKANVYVIAGPNGAGKTTFARTFLPTFIGLKTFINADLIASGIAPLDAQGAALRAGKLLLSEIETALKSGKDFSFETTLSGKSYVHWFKRLIESGYAIHVLFLWIPNLSLSLKRVSERVKRGGHDIPEVVVKRRFYRGIQNLFHLYQPFLSSWAVYDNSSVLPELITYCLDSETTILSQDRYEQVLKAAGEK